MSKAKTVVLYLRVSTGEQTVENQRQELLAAAERRGWRVVAEFCDEGRQRRQWARQTAGSIASAVPLCGINSMLSRRGASIVSVAAFRTWWHSSASCAALGRSGGC